MHMTARAQKANRWSDRLTSRSRTNKKTARTGRKTRKLAIEASSNLALVGAKNEVVERVANKILDRGLTEDDANTLAARTMIETLTGQSMPEHLPEAGEVAKAVLNGMADMASVGIEQGSDIQQNAINRIVREGLHGERARDVVGAAVIEKMTGKPAPDSLSKAGEVAKALLKAMGDMYLGGIEQGSDTQQKTMNRIVQEGLYGERADAAVMDVLGPILERIKADQESSSEATDDKGTHADGLGGTAAPESGPAGTGPHTTETTESASTAPAEATQPAGSSPSSDTGNTTAGAITGTLHNIHNNADGSGTYDVTITYPDGTTELRHVTVNADGSSTITRGDGTTESYPPGSTAMPPSGTEGQTAVVNQDTDGDGNNDSATYGSDDDGDDGDDDDDNDGDSAGDGDDDSQNQGGDGGTPNDSGEDQPAASGTPNPEQQDGGSASALSEASEGRLGRNDAQREQDRLELMDQGGGAAGPKAGDDESSGVLLTPEEHANAERGIGVKTGGGVTTPSPMQEGSSAVTERDLKELWLRRHGGAGTPDDVVNPVNQPPQSPLSPPSGVPGVGGDPITGLGSLRAVPTLSSFQRFDAWPRVAALPEKGVATTSSPAALLAAGAIGLDQMASDVLSQQTGGLLGAEMNLRNLGAFQAAQLLA